MELLLEEGVDKNIKNRWDKTPLNEAMSNRCACEMDTTDCDRKHLFAAASDLWSIFVCNYVGNKAERDPGRGPWWSCSRSGRRGRTRIRRQRSSVLPRGGEQPRLNSFAQTSPPFLCLINYSAEQGKSRGAQAAHRFESRPRRRELRPADCDSPGKCLCTPRAVLIHVTSFPVRSKQASSKKNLNAVELLLECKANVNVEDRLHHLTQHFFECGPDSATFDAGGDARHCKTPSWRVTSSWRIC